MSMHRDPRSTSKQPMGGLAGLGGARAVGGLPGQRAGLSGGIPGLRGSLPPNLVQPGPKPRPPAANKGGKTARGVEARGEIEGDLLAAIRLLERQVRLRARPALARRRPDPFPQCLVLWCAARGRA